MPATQLRRYPQILASILSRVVARSNLTDVTTPSRFKRFIAGTAREFDEVYYQIVRVTDVWSLDRATGEDLDRRVADLQPLGLVRVGPRRATGQLVFSRRASTGGLRIIPSGTVAQTASGITVRSTREAEITDTSAQQIAGHGVGRDSAPIPAVAVAPGSSGNLISGAVTRLSATIPGVDDVVSVAPFINGLDGESDDALRARAKAYIASLARCGYRAVELAAIGVTDGTRQVTFARALINPERRGEVTLFIDDGTGSAETTATVTNELVTLGLTGPPPDRARGGEDFLNLFNPPVRLESGYQIRQNGTALVNDSSVFLDPVTGLLRFVPTLVTGDEIRADYVQEIGLVAAVQKVINGVRADSANFPGWGAVGVRIRVRTPRVVSPTIAGTLFLEPNTDRPTAVAAAQSAAIALVNGSGISDDLVVNQIIERVMEVPGVVDMTLTAPLENIVVLDDEIARVATPQVTFT